MTSNIKQFIKETNEAIKKEQEKQQSKARMIIVTAYSEIMKKSPVDKGHFKGNNILTYNKKAPQGVARLDTRDDENNSMTAEDESQLNSIKWNDGDKIYIQNNLDYAKYIENGSSTQAPKGVYKISERIVKKAIKDLKL